jgi:hypothetical protein
MALNNGINVRLEPSIRARLETLANSYGVKSSVLIRLAVTEKVAQLESGKPLFPPHGVVIQQTGNGNKAKVGRH